MKYEIWSSKSYSKSYVVKEIFDKLGITLSPGLCLLMDWHMPMVDHLHRHNDLTHWPLGNATVILKLMIFKLMSRIDIRVCTGHFQDGVLEPYGMHWIMIIEDIMTFLPSDNKPLTTSEATRKNIDWWKGTVLIKDYSPIHFYDWCQEWKYIKIFASGSWWKVNIGSGNGLVPSGSKPLPDPMLTQINNTIYIIIRTQWVKPSET